MFSLRFPLALLFTVPVLLLPGATALAEEADPDRTRFLSALSRFHDGDHEGAIRELAPLTERRTEGGWLRKARFLTARALIELRRFPEAEEIYEAEAKRLLGEGRKEEIAAVILDFADALAKKPDPTEEGALPTGNVPPVAMFKKAHNLYRKVLEMEIGRSLRDDVMWKSARAAQEMKDLNGAIAEYRAYLLEFDPDWTGPVGSPDRLANQKRENPPAPGGHIREARYQLAVTQIAANRPADARRNLTDMIAIMERIGGIPSEARANARWQLVRTWYPKVHVPTLEQAVRAAEAFLADHGGDPRAVIAAWWIADGYQRAGRSDDAIAAYEAFASGKRFRLPEGDLATAKLTGFSKSPAEFWDELRKEAVFRVAVILVAQKKYAAAIEAFESYVNKYPNGPQWANSQKGIIDAEFQMGLEALAEKDYAKVRARFRAFLGKYPLDNRARQILFILGQIHSARADSLKETDEAKAGEAYAAAVEEWTRLVSKYPRTEESSLALYRIGRIQEEHLGDLEAALAAYRRLTWGSYAGKARERIAAMTQKRLELTTERAFRTNEPAAVTLNVRNVEKVTVRLYSLDLEAFFRKTHGIINVEALDTALIEPDKTWEVEIADFRKFAPIEQKVEVPFEPGKPGVFLLNVSEEDWEATTLVLRSDIDLIAKSSRREVLVFAQDMVKDAPATGVRLLLSDGREVFETGVTGADGVYRGTLERLKSAADVRVLAVRGGHIASNLLNLAGMRLAQGLTAKGYIYTDRPAYLPGQKVGVKGILRQVKDGSYVAPAGETVVVRVMDSEGRLIWGGERKLSEFGSFDASVPLDGGAALGDYTVLVSPKDDEKAVYRGAFKVKQFQLQKMSIAIAVPRKVYFRGETVELTIAARYYWGEPVADRQVRYGLPDGRSLTGRTGRDGKLKASFDTTGLTPGTAMAFTAEIEGEDVRARKTVPLARLGFGIGVEASRSLVLSGEPFDVTIRVKLPDGEPAARKGNLTVLRREVPKPDPVLAGVPWVRVPQRPAAEVTVSEHAFTTDEEAGEAVVRLRLGKGGRYVLRAAGEDRFGQVVTAEGTVTISDDDDATKLRIFSNSDTLKVGEKATVRLHSRVASGLALITFDGEEVLSHRVARIGKGMHDIALDVGHEHFPNFRVTATVMDERKLRTAAKDFKVERKLSLTIRPLADPVAPGAEGRVEVTAVDQLGNPVKAEISLSLVDEALFARFTDGTPGILDFFQKGAKRYAAFRVVATNEFTYRGRTRKVVKAFLDEKDRQQRMAEEVQALANAQEELRSLAQTADRRNRRPQAQSGEVRYRGPAGSVPPGQRDPADPGPPPEAPRDHNETDNDLPFNANEMDNDFPGEDINLVPSGGFGFDGEEEARLERQSPGRWLPVVVTGEDGKATVEIPMPDSTTKWRITARGSTPETLVGEATGNVVTRKDFFVSMKAPAALIEGDKVRVLARIHNLTEYAGPGELVLRVYRGGDPEGRLLERRVSVEVGAHGLTESLLPSFDIPADSGLRFVLYARAGNHEDALARDVTVRPWGMEFADHAGGAATGDAAVKLELPKGKEYLSRWLTVSVGPNVERAVVEMALGGGLRRSLSRLAPASGHPGGELLAAVSALAYAKSAGLPAADYQRLLARARAQVGTLVVTQSSDGGWSWRGGRRARSDAPLTATAYWALARARQEGLAVNDQTLAKAETWLTNRFRAMQVGDNDSKAMILHALSVAGKAEFAHLNRLHRERNSLSRLALAYAALAFANRDRKDFAGELIDVLLKQAKRTEADGRKLCHWPGTRHPGRNELRYVGEVEATSIGLLALVAVRPEAAEVRQAVEFIMHRRGCHGYVHGRGRGPAIAALAAYFSRGKFADTDSRIRLLVNGKEVRTFNSRGERPLVTVDVPRDKLGNKAVTVEFRTAGRGEYAYAATLSGFSKSLDDPKRVRGPYVESRRYYHDNLEYRGRRLRAESDSRVSNIEVGQRFRVRVHFGEPRYSHGHLVIEEPLPAGMVFVEGSLKGYHTRYEVKDGRLYVYYEPHLYPNVLFYELAGYASGDYRILPTVIRDAMSTEVLRMGKPAELTVLAPDEKSDDTYKLNIHERFELAKLLFEDGRFKEALPHLTKLFENRGRPFEKDVARMLLWIYTAEGAYDARRIVDAFEALRERYPDLEIPFDKILVVGRAYRDIGEHERAYLVFKATIDASFLNDSNVSAVLEDEGQFLGSIEYQEELWRQYPDTAEVATAYFALSQALYTKAPKAHELAAAERRLAAARGRDESGAAAKTPNRIDMLKDAIRLLHGFLEVYPKDPLADDAAFSLANAYLDLKQYETVVKLCGGFAGRFDESDFVSGFKYMAALGHFWQHDYDKALDAARVVGEGESKDRDFARYIVGQIHHAEGNPEDAIAWYRKVEKTYSDAKEAIGYFEEKRISLEEVEIVRPGKPAEIKLDYRNIKEAAIQVYRVDLMKLYLREKNLSTITKVHLAGIRPELEKTVTLGDGKDYVDKERKVKLDLTEEAAYLVICRGDDLFTSGLVLITPLKIEVQEDPKSGRLRANVLDTVKDAYAAEVHVKAIGSMDKTFRSGDTDMRGVFVADNLRGTATVIAKTGDSRYAFHRGETWLGASAQQRGRTAPVPPGQRDQVDYKRNLRDANRNIQDFQGETWNKLRRQQSKGVKVQEAK